MDALLSAALQEVAVEGIQGCSLPKLWARLQAAAAGGGTASSSSLSKTQLTARTKQMLWQQLLKIPGLLLLLLQDESAQTELLECSSPSIQSVEEAETLGVCMIAPEGLRDCCLGIYDLKFCDAHLSKDQRDILERLARARSHGITQSQLAKDFKIGGNKMFYVLKSLEARGLVMRQATIVRTQLSLTESALLQPNNNVPIVTTNLVHLTRYMKEQALGSHQRFEIRSSNCNVSNMPPSVSGDTSCAQENSSQGDGLYINDDFPAMAQVCERLEVADGKV